MSRILKSVINAFKQREQVGKTKYGTTLDRTDLTVLDVLQHLQEECMDATMYLEYILQKMRAELPRGEYIVTRTGITYTSEEGIVSNYKTLAELISDNVSRGK